LDGPGVVSLRTLVEKVDELTVFVGSGVAPGREVFRQLGDKAVCLGVSSPRVSTICRLGRMKFEKGGGEDIFALEPIYLRPSYADTAGKLSIEPMRLEQLDEIGSIETESFRYPWSKNAFTWEINSNMTLSMVGMIDKKVAGYFVLWMAYDEMHLGNIAVAKRWRRRGVGEKMMKWLLQEARRRNVTRLTLEVRTCNYPAIALYKKFGFREVALRKRYYPEGVDAYLMSLELSEQ
jgi:ribosomal-protein-alanine N-acetyltransferase